MTSLHHLLEEALKAVAEASNLDSLEATRIHYLGKKGLVSEQMKKLGTLAPEERKTFGADVNQVKESIETALSKQKTTLAGDAIAAKIAGETVDITLPTRSENKGSIHPIMHVIEEAISILASLGFSVVEGPEIEDDFHNFTALNISENHPARQMQDTFYLRADSKDSQTPLLLRTHTSSVQIRSMSQNKPPFRIIAPGRVYRSDYDMTHTPMFHQIEGLFIDKNIHMGHLKGCLHTFLTRFFELDTVPLRFRPSFFPFTEPSAEVDIGCKRSDGELKIGQGSDWLEILGCGMVHQNVLKNVGIDPNEYQGFAFGIGIERLAMLKYGMPDLRAFFDSDVRWLNHYSFDTLDIPTQRGGYGA
jgi:phenylalanyl-tRNA synthetase alpha chain